MTDDSSKLPTGGSDETLQKQCTERKPKVAARASEVNASSLMMSALTFLVVASAVLAAMGFKGRVTTVGIDLGTTFSVIAYSHYGKVTVITDKEYNLHVRRRLGVGTTGGKINELSWYDQEHSIFPSMVSFMEDGQSVVGYEAQKRLSDDPRNTIFNAKRFIGRTLDEPEVQQYASSHPFRAVAVANATTSFGAVGFNLSVFGHTELNSKAMRTKISKASSWGGGKVFVDDSSSFPATPATVWGSLISPEYVGSLVLKHLLTLASYHLGHSMVKNAIIAVPAKFNPEQRQATGAAYRAAGLKVLRVVDEPTAAAVAYKLHKRSNIHHILVYDFGGGTLDVSLLFVSRGSVQVYATDGDESLGGSDFDLCLYNLILSKLEKQHGFTPPTIQQGGPGTLAAAGLHDDLCSHSALQQKAERLKKHLSSSDSAVVSCSLYSAKSDKEGSSGVSVYQQVQLPIVLEEFHSSCSRLFDRGLAPVTRLLTELEMTPDHVDEVVLVGGTTRIPRVKQMLRDHFKKPLNDHIDPDITVAVGAASILD